MIAQSFLLQNPGNTYHQDAQGNYLPILPRGDPNKPRAQPRFSVAGSNPGPKEKEFAAKNRRDEIIPQNREGTSSSSNKTVIFKTSKNSSTDDVETPENINVDYKTSNNETFDSKTSNKKNVDTKTSDETSVDVKTSNKTFTETKTSTNKNVNIKTSTNRNVNLKTTARKLNDPKPMIDDINFDEGVGIFFSFFFLHFFKF